MTRRPELYLILVPVAVLLIIFVGGFVLLSLRLGGSDQLTTGLTSAAELESPDGESVGIVSFRQESSGVLIMAEVNGLAPGGHAFIIHEVGACKPDFSAAGDHFNPDDVDHGFVSPAWRIGGSRGGHRGDLPNIYAGSDGSARADFFTTGITLDTGEPHSIFDSDGSAIIVHEKPDPYEGHEADTGARVACGVIRRT